MIKFLFLCVFIYILIKILITPSQEHFKDKEYWEYHDPNFIKNANLKYFDREIKKYDIAAENSFLVDILLNSPQNSIFLDVGAYDGNTCIPIAEQLKNKNRGDIRIIAFEPKKNLCDKINLTAIEKNLNLKCISIVLSNKKGVIYNKKEEGSGNMFHKDFKGEKFNADTLDNQLKNLGVHNIFLLKIDVEGHEPEVLEGSKNILKDTQHIYIEVWNESHIKERNGIENGSHNINILKHLNNFNPIQKIEKNIYFKNKNQLVENFENEKELVIITGATSNYFDKFSI